MSEQITYREADGKAFVKSPYSPQFVTLAKQSGARWNAATREWVWAEDNADLARRAVREAYGVDVEQPKAAPVSIEVDAGVLPEADGELLLGGVAIARRRYRDDPVRLAPNVAVIRGELSASGGSRANPAVWAGHDVWLRVRDVLPAQIAWLKDNVDADAWRVITPETQRVEALKRERAELLARVHDIDVQLEKLDTGLHHDDGEAVA